jgi:hypothetical protein
MFTTVIFLLHPFNSTFSMATREINPREQIFDLISGTSVVVPDLQAMMAHWSAATNTNLELLEKATTARFEWLFLGKKSKKRLQKMHKTHAALFAAMWWPYAPLQALYTVAWLSIWLFVWDDDTDCTEFADLVHDFKRVSEFRCETLQLIRESLRLHEGSRSHDRPYSSDSTVISDRKHHYPKL